MMHAIYNYTFLCSHPLPETAFSSPVKTSADPAKEEQLPCMVMTQLPTNDFDHIVKMAEKNPDLRKQLGSQGLKVSQNSSSAYLHESTYSSVSYNDKQLKHYVNMDRGAFFTKTDGTNGACVCDGLGGDGCFSAFVAQMVTQAVVKEFASSASKFHRIHDTIQTEAARFFTMLSQSLIYQRASQYRKLPYSGMGSTTVAVANFVTIADTVGSPTFLVQAATIGDSSIFHLSMSKKEVVSVLSSRRSITSSHTSSIDNFCSINYANDLLETCITKVQPEDIIILATDGLTDNIRDGELCKVITRVVFSTFFDQPQEMLLKLERPWEKKYCQLPSIEDLEAFMQLGTCLPSDAPTPVQIVSRLFAYTRVVTWYLSSLYEKEDQGKQVFFPPLSQHDSKPDDCMIIAIRPKS